MELINNWNFVVNEDDEVYILGDVSWKNMKETLNILKQLKGKKHLVRGNHDEGFDNSDKFSHEFQWIKDYAEIKDNGRNVVLSHYPICFYKNMPHGWYHLFGHTHITNDEKMNEKFLDISFATYNIERRAFNVGCMQPWINYYPRTLDEIINNYNNYKEIERK